ACRNWLTQAASNAAACPVPAEESQRVGMPATSMTSFTPNGMPANGPDDVGALRAATVSATCTQARTSRSCFRTCSLKSSVARAWPCACWPWGPEPGVDVIVNWNLACRSGGGYTAGWEEWYKTNLGLYTKFGPMRDEGLPAAYYGLL